jgi:antitoxin ParD1/3/4
MARSTSFALSDHFVEFIERQIETGRYSSASEVVREGLRLLEEREQHLVWLREQIALGDQDIQEGRITEDSDELWEALDRRVESRVRERQVRRSGATT